MRILIIVDMQNDFIEGVLSTPINKSVILPNVINKVKKFKYDKIFLTKDTHSDNDSLEFKHFPIHCIKNSKGSEINNDLLSTIKKSNYEIIEKSSFGSLKLIDKLKQIDNIESIEIIGLVSDICVISNALLIKSAFPNTSIIVDSSCCNGTSKKYHNSAINIMKSCLIEVIN